MHVKCLEFKSKLRSRPPVCAHARDGAGCVFAPRMRCATVAVVVLLRGGEKHRHRHRRLVDDSAAASNSWPATTQLVPYA